MVTSPLEDAAESESNIDEPSFPARCPFNASRQVNSHCFLGEHYKSKTQFIACSRSCSCGAGASGILGANSWNLREDLLSLQSEPFTLPMTSTLADLQLGVV